MGSRRPAGRRAKAKQGRLPVAARLEQALEQHRRGRLAEAIAGYEQVLGRDRKNLDALMNLGHALTATGHRTAALARYRQALELEPDVAELHSDYAAALIELGLWDEAEAALERALQLEEGHAPAWQRLALRAPRPQHPHRAGRRAPHRLTAQPRPAAAAASACGQNTR